MREADTIIAIATSMSDAGIGIVRASGKKAIACADRVVVNAKKEHDLTKRAANTIRFSYVLARDGSVLDEALVSVMRAPFSYTGEDLVEINVHGGHLVMEETLLLLLEAGKKIKGEGQVRLSEPGEYTKRAFLAGKMDLTKAEAVQDLIASDNEFALKNAAKQLGGALRDTVLSLRSRILHETAFLEAALDDPDVYEEELATYGDHLTEVLRGISGEIAELLRHHEEGVLRKDGFSCAIIGPVNAGKSSLLNALTKREKAIVTDIPGTTRDIIEETVRLQGVLLHLADTAGIRKSADPVEEEGVRRALSHAKEAFLTLLVFDASSSFEGEEEALLSEASLRRTFILLNKSDLLTEREKAAKLFETEDFFRKKELPAPPVFFISAKTGEGIAPLVNHLTALAKTDENAPKQEYFLTNLRHKEAMKSAYEALTNVLTSVEEGRPEDLYLVDLMDAYVALSSIIGENVSEDLIDRIFSDFCMGK